MINKNTIIRHIETSVDDDEWAIIGVKENFEKLDKIEKIINEWNNDASNSFSDMCKINMILKK